MIEKFNQVISMVEAFKESERVESVLKATPRRIENETHQFTFRAGGQTYGVRITGPQYDGQNIANAQRYLRLVGLDTGRNAAEAVARTARSPNNIEFFRVNENGSETTLTQTQRNGLIIELRSIGNDKPAYRYAGRVTEG